MRVKFITADGLESYADVEPVHDKHFVDYKFPLRVKRILKGQNLPAVNEESEKLVTLSVREYELSYWTTNGWDRIPQYTEILK